MKRYLLTEKAHEDLELLRDYLAETGGIGVSRYVLRKIREALDFLSRMPESGHLRDDLTDARLKFWSVFSYLIVYDPSKRPIEILRIIHASREIERSLPRDDDK